jgi:flagellar motor switch protein FliN/FliY
VANENDDLLNPAEIEALLKSASGGSPPGPGAAGGPASSPSPSTPTSSPSQPLSSRDIDALLNEQSRTAPASGNPEALLERAAADLAAAVAPDLNSPGSHADQAAAARPFEFQAFDQGAHSDRSGDLSDLKDVELDLRIELGRTELLIEEVLKLREGSVVALDKLAGDPVDIFVNGRLIARGEVLILNENFCVRVAELMAPEAAASAG